MPAQSNQHNPGAAKAKQESAAEPETVSYRVTKAITLGDGRTLMPGETLAIATGDPDWPERRPGQLVKSGHLSRLEG